MGCGRSYKEVGSSSDYIAKPVNTEELPALLRIRLFGKKRR